jgi:hypothetical protein
MSAKRRPRNFISRNTELSIRAAALLDDGLGDAAVADMLRKEFPKKAKEFSARTVGSFRKADYETYRAERATRQETSQKVRMILEGAADYKINHTEAATALLARQLYEIMSSGPQDVDTLKAIGQELGRIMALQHEAARVEILQRKAAQLDQAESVLKNAMLTDADRIKNIRKIFE